MLLNHAPPITALRGEMPKAPSDEGALDTLPPITALSGEVLYGKEQSPLRLHS
ncbi:MAG: hypothetical protein IJP01_04225 [Oscillospiraceae bacterium]|nr:hypothetical protein [Oscillospiraceae bacterium]